MSRRITTGSSHTDEYSQSISDTTYGKVIFTTYKGQLCGLYLCENRLLAAQVMDNGTSRIGAVYIGKIKNIVKNIDACFVEIANGEICFLARKDAYNPILLNRKYDGRLLEGDELLIQLCREAQKTKQASVTANLSLSNEYAVISIGSKRVGYSGKLEKSKKEEIRNWLIQNKLLQGTDFGYEDVNEKANKDTEDMKPSLGLVLRTKAGTCTEEVLLGKLHELMKDFHTMIQTAQHRTCFSCIRRAPEEFEAILDQMVYSYEYNEILTDDTQLFDKLSAYCKEHLPDKTVRLYQDETFSLSKLYSLESKLDTALNKRIWLKSGGYLVIEQTEALTVIDVNTGKYEATGPSSDTFEVINREAAREVAIQLRLRNLSGIIIVDFINMKSKEAEENLLHYLQDLVHKDKVKTSVVDITPLGLVEITRKKQNKTLREQFIKVV